MCGWTILTGETGVGVGDDYGLRRAAMTVNNGGDLEPALPLGP